VPALLDPALRHSRWLQDFGYTTLVLALLAGCGPDDEAPLHEGEGLPGVRRSLTVESAVPFQEDLPPLLSAPARFERVEETQRGPGGDGRMACAQRLRDPGDGTELILSESYSEATRERRGDTLFVEHRLRGDYVPSSWERYGLEVGQAVRVDCARDAPLGVVTQHDPPGAG